MFGLNGKSGHIVSEKIDSLRYFGRLWGYLNFIGQQFLSLRFPWPQRCNIMAITDRGVVLVCCDVGYVENHAQIGNDWLNI